MVKGIGKEQTIQSVVAIHVDEQGKISKVEDRWNGSLPDGAISNVSSVFQLVNPLWWINYWMAWGFWLWSFTWETRVWRVGAFLVLNASEDHIGGAFTDCCAQAFRHLNAVTVPKVVSVPKSEEEEAKMKSK